MESLDFWPFNILIIKNEITVVKCVVTLQCVLCVCLSLACNLSLSFYFVLSNTIVVDHFSSYSVYIPYRSEAVWDSG